MYKTVQDTSKSKEDYQTNVMPYISRAGKIIRSSAGAVAGLALILAATGCSYSPRAGPPGCDLILIPLDPGPGHPGHGPLLPLIIPIPR